VPKLPFHRIRTCSREAHTPATFRSCACCGPTSSTCGSPAMMRCESFRDWPRVAAAAPPLLRRAIERRLRGEYEQKTVVVGAGSMHEEHVAATLIRLVHDQDERPSGGTNRSFDGLAEKLRASRVDVCSADAGPVSTLVNVGAGLPTRLGQRVLEAESRSAGAGRCCPGKRLACRFGRDASGCRASRAVAGRSCSSGGGTRDHGDCGLR
jgi:hypothetical protein